MRVRTRSLDSVVSVDATNFEEMGATIDYVISAEAGNGDTRERGESNARQ